MATAMTSGPVSALTALSCGIECGAACCHCANSCSAPEKVMPSTHEPVGHRRAERDADRGCRCRPGTAAPARPCAPIWPGRMPSASSMPNSRVRSSTLHQQRVEDDERRRRRSGWHRAASEKLTSSRMRSCRRRLAAPSSRAAPVPRSRAMRCSAGSPVWNSARLPAGQRRSCWRAPPSAKSSWKRASGISIIWRSISGRAGREDPDHRQHVGGDRTVISRRPASSACSPMRELEIAGEARAHHHGVACRRVSGSGPW